MSSSTSSSEGTPLGRPTATGGRKALLLSGSFLLALVVLEVATRLLLFPASKDYSRFARYPERARQLMARPAPRVALIGNSATERGVVLPLLEQELARRGAPASTEMFVADASHVNTWYWMAERELWKQGLSPDLVVINYYTGLEDGSTLEVPRLARFFTERADWPEVFAHDLPDLDRRFDFVVSAGWATFAARDRIRERVLDLIPGYKDYIQDANAVNFAAESRSLAARGGGGAARAAVPTTRDLERLLNRARAMHTRIAFVAFPVRPESGAPPYEVRPAERQLIEGAGMVLVDLHRMPELRAEHYEDEIHLTPVGRAIYTPRLAEQLASVLRRDAR